MALATPFEIEWQKCMQPPLSHIKQLLVHASDLQAFYTFAPMAADLDRVSCSAESMSKTEHVY